MRLASAFFAGYSAGGMPWLNAGAVCGAVYGAALCWLGIRVKAEGYKLAGVMSLLALVMNALNSLIAEASFVNAVILGAAIAAQLYGEYGECAAMPGCSVCWAAYTPCTVSAGADSGGGCLPRMLRCL